MLTSSDRQTLELWKLPCCTLLRRSSSSRGYPALHIKAALDDFAKENPSTAAEMQELRSGRVKAVQDEPGLSVEDSLRKGHDYARRLYSDQYTTTNGTKRRHWRSRRRTDAQWLDHQTVVRPEARAHEALEDHVLGADDVQDETPNNWLRLGAPGEKRADMFKGR